MDRENAQSGQEMYLFSSFDNEKDGLLLAYSENLYNWKQISGLHLKPKIGDNIMRDPFISRGPNGIYHMVWTSGWGRRDIGYACTRDLVTWSEQRLLPLMKQRPAAKNCWAPKIFYDELADQWQIVWSSWVDDGSFGEPDLPHTSKNHRIWYTTTADFETVNEPRLLFDPGYSCIDAYLLQDTGKYHLFFKDERYNNSKKFTPAHQNIRVAHSENQYGPFGDVSGPITGNGSADWHNEGPCALQINGTYYVFYDHQYDRSYFGAVRSDDLEHWEDISEMMDFPEGFKHGHIIRAPRSIIQYLALVNH